MRVAVIWMRREILIALVAFVAAESHAEVAVEPGFGGQVQISGGQIEVPASAGKTVGKNLFHSFSVFNVGNDQSVTFTGPDAIKNVISRVTGKAPSQIDGPVSVAIPDANFYFFNPYGVVFGPGGSVSATGSVHISTADRLELKEAGHADGVFNANPNLESTLTSAAPAAFGFLGSAPAPIQVEGSTILEPVPAGSGKSFSLVGGDIAIRGGTVIFAPGADVTLVSVASPGNIGVRADGGVDLGTVDKFSRLGSVTLTASVIDVGDLRGGSIFVRSGALNLSPGLLLAQTFGDNDGGVVDIGVRGDVTVGTNPEIGNSAIIAGTYGGLGTGPAIRLDVGGTLDISDGSFVVSESFGPGRAGDIDIRAGTLRVRGLGLGEFTGIGADTLGISEGPSIRIAAQTVEVLNGGNVGTRNLGLGPAPGGALSIEAGSVLLTGTGDPTASLSTETLGGDAGDLTIKTGTLEVRDGARISASTAGFGNAGTVRIDATEQVTVNGELSGIFSSTVAKDADVGDAGNAGTLTVSTPRLVVDGGVIDSTTVGDGDAGAVSVKIGELRLTSGGQIRSFSGGYDQSNNNQLVVGRGAAGSVTVVATGSVTISGTTASGFPSALLAETRGEGAGGSVTLNARDLTLSDRATISSSSLGTGLAGDVRITLGDSLTMRNASIATQAITSDGGNIEIRVPRLIDMLDSRITTSVQSGVGGGGNIFIDPQFLVLQRSQIIANAFGGPGGNIDIIAGQLIADPFSVIEASSELGIDGSVNIDAPNPDVGSNLVVLPENFLDAARLLQPNCGAARAGLSSLVEVGRGGLPPEPDGYLWSTTRIGAPTVPAGGLDLGGLPGDGVVLADLSCTK